MGTKPAEREKKNDMNLTTFTPNSQCPPKQVTERHQGRYEEIYPPFMQKNPKPPLKKSQAEETSPSLGKKVLIWQIATVGGKFREAGLRNLTRCSKTKSLSQRQACSEPKTVGRTGCGKRRGKKTATGKEIRQNWVEEGAPGESHHWVHKKKR